MPFQLLGPCQKSSSGTFLLEVQLWWWETCDPGVKKQIEIFLGTGKCYKEKQTGDVSDTGWGWGNVGWKSGRFFEAVAFELNREWEKMRYIAGCIKAQSRWARQVQWAQKMLGDWVVTGETGPEDHYKSNHPGVRWNWIWLSRQWETTESFN